VTPYLIGAIAGLSAATLWTFSSLLFTFAGHAIGSMTVNRLRLAMALILLMLWHLMATGQPVPLAVSGESWFWLALSGIVGLVIGDSMLFRSYLIIGPRSAMILMTLAPVFATLLAWLLLGEILTLIQIGGIAITSIGVAYAISHHPRIVKQSSEGSTTLGILLGLGAGFCQGVGLILARLGLTEAVTALSGNVIRIGTATIAIFLLAAFSGKLNQTLASLRLGRPISQVALGSLVGPTVGVWLSLVAVKYAPVGVASSLMSTTPILLIPFSTVFLKEHIRYQSIVGTLVAVAGVAFLFLAG